MFYVGDIDYECVCVCLCFVLVYSGDICEEMFWTGYQQYVYLFSAGL